MADTAIKTEEEKKEYFETPEELDRKCTLLAQWIRESEYMSCFTGAGISTSTGIPDYRSGYGTCLPTGPGCWEKAAYKQKYKDELIAAGKPLPSAHRIPFNMTIQQARPSLTHMALVELANQNILKGIISQNVDGLHRKSGIHPDMLAELHGNTNLEICMKCGREHMRDYRTRNAQKAKDHKTGRKCDTPGCGGDLKDTIINFGENLNQDILEKGFIIGMLSDLCICMGSSMRVQPAAQMPMGVKNKENGKLVVFNLQATPIDMAADLIIHEQIDKIMELLMQKLDIQIPEFRRSYRLKVSLDEKDNKRVKFTGIDSNGACYTLFKNLKIKGLDRADANFPSRAQAIQPFVQTQTAKNVTHIEAECTFQGHYNEPVMKLKIPMDAMNELKAIEFNMVYHVASGKFEKVEMLHAETKDVLGLAEFSTVQVRQPAQAAAPQQRRASPPARLGAAAAASVGPKAGPANRGKSTNVVAKSRPAINAGAPKARAG